MGGKTASVSSPRIANLAVQTSALGLVVPAIYGGTARLKVNLLWYNGFSATAQTTQTGGKGGGGGVTQTTYTYFADLIMGLCWGGGKINAVTQVYRDKSTFSTPGAAGLSFASGAIGQAVWGYLSSAYPAQALGYSGMAYLYASKYPLSDQASLANHSAEMQSTVRVSGKADANPMDLVTEFLTNTLYGVPGWAAGLIDDLSDYGNYCLASNLLLTLSMDQQSAANSVLTDLMTATNSNCYWSEGLLKIRPKGDSSVTGNGVTWLPDLTPIYALNDDNFLVDEGSNDPPVLVDKLDQSDAYNIVQIEYLDRANQYNTAVATAQDQANIVQFTRRKKDPVSLHTICDKDVARVAVQILLQNTLYVRDKYYFELPWSYALLEQSDLLAITDVGLGANNVLVRILQIDDDEQTCRKITAEGVPVGPASAPLYTNQGSDGTVFNNDVAPGSVSTPYIFSPPATVTSSGLAQETWAAVSGGANWGGCEVWISLDGTNYSMAGVMYGRSRYGYLTTALASHADPDSTNTPGVDLSTSLAALDAGTTADADALATLCLVGGSELISYRDATLTSAFRYTLGYLRRGALGTPIGAWVAGDPFVRIDTGVFRFPYIAAAQGQTVYAKFASFNSYGRATQDLSACTAYTFVPGQSGTRAPSASFWTATGTTITSPVDGSAFPVIRVAGTFESNGVEALEVGYRPGGTTGLYTHYDRLPYNAMGATVDIGGLASAVAYDIGLAYVYNGLVGSYLNIASVTAGTFAGSGGAVDKTPTAINWANQSATGGGTQQVVFGAQAVNSINVPVTFLFTYTNTALWEYSLNGGSWTTIASGGSVTGITVGQTLNWRCTNSSTVTSVGTVTNTTDGGAAIDTFTATLTISGADATPNSLNWSDIGDTDFAGQGQNDTLNVFGINVPVTFHAVITPSVGAAPQLKWSINGGTYHTVASGADMSTALNNNDTLSWMMRILTPGHYAGSVTITNTTDGGAAIDTFNYDLNPV